MSFRKNWDLASIQHGIWCMRSELTNPYNDGFVTWPIKQDLYRLKWLIDESLAKSSTYVGEAEWLEEEEKKRVWKILKND